MSSISHARLLTELDATGRSFLASFEGMSAEQWGRKPGPDAWSVGETAEHTTIVMRRITHTLTKSILSQPLPAEGEKGRIADELIVQRLFDRGTRRNAPEAVLPTGRWATAAECRVAYLEAERELKMWIEGLTEDLRQYGSPHPAMGLLDGMQWLIFLSAHTERHTRQVQEIRRQLGEVT